MQLEYLVTLGKAIHQFYGSDAAGSLGPELISDSQKDSGMCAVVRRVHISTCFQEKWISSSRSQRQPSRLS